MAEDKLAELVRAWCIMRVEYDLENFPGRLPNYQTAYKLYHAGRALFEAVDIKPGPGRYGYNEYFVEPIPDRLAALRDAGTEPSD